MKVYKGLLSEIPLKTTEFGKDIGKIFSNSLLKSQPFVLSESVLPLNQKIQIQVDRELNPPFSDMFIEMAGAQPLFSDVPWENNLKLEIYGIGIFPEGLALLGLVQSPQHSVCLMATHERNEKNKEGDARYAVMRALAAHLCELINNANNKVPEEIKEIVKYGKRSQNKSHVIRRIIHVGSKSYIRSLEKSGRKLDWSHRFSVRGHWRNLEEPTKLGKDRNGDFCVYGKTWVNDFIKGPEDKPYIKKTRVVK